MQANHGVGDMDMGSDATAQLLGARHVRQEARPYVVRNEDRGERQAERVGKQDVRPFLDAQADAAHEADRPMVNFNATGNYVALGGVIPASDPKSLLDVGWMADNTTVSAQ